MTHGLDNFLYSFILHKGFIVPVFCYFYISLFLIILYYILCLFNYYFVLVGMINDVVNKNFDMFIKELMPIIEKALAAVFKEAANAIVESYTYEQLFP